MTSKAFQPVPNEPALFIKEEKILVVADLHIGIESELQEQGVHAPPQTPLMLQRLQRLCSNYKPEDIVLLGDVKHMIPSSTIQERSNVKQFLQQVQSFGCVHIIPGNHDGNLHRFVPEGIHFHPSNGEILGDMGFIHGHRWPREEIMECGQVVVAHAHPTIMLTDRRGYKTFEPCWIRGNCKRDILSERFPSAANPDVIVIPAFNQLCGGIAINDEAFLGPFGKVLDIENASVYLLDGSSLGKIHHLK